MTPHSTIGAGCLLIEENQVLLVKPNYGKAKGSWIFPGGFVEPGETPQSAALRELKEETGQTGQIIKPLCVRYRLDPADAYWVFSLRRQMQSQLSVQSNELIDVQFLPLDYALKSHEVRPMTRYFIECALSKNPGHIPVPSEFAENNFVYFINAESPTG